MCHEQCLISSSLGNNTVIAFLPSMSEIGGEIGKSLFGSWMFVPVGTRLNEDTCIFDCSEGQVDGSHFRNTICSTGSFSKLACSGDASEDHLDSVIRIPFSRDVATVLLEYFWSDLTVCHVEMGKKSFELSC